jgi:hypothetical protein
VVDREEEQLHERSNCMSNDVMEALLRRLSPRAREVYDEVVKLSERAAREDTNPNELHALANALLDGLSPSDRADVRKVLSVQAKDHQHRGEEEIRKGEEIVRATALIQRAKDLDRAEGKPVSNMTVNLAIERLREAGKLSEEDERFIERVKDMEVEIPAIEKIEHEEISVHWDKTPEGHIYAHFGEHDELIDRLETYYEYVLLTAAAAVYNMTGSLDTAASTLGLAGFQTPAGYIVEDENVLSSGEDTLPFWIDENRNRILGFIDSTPAKIIAHGETLE